MLETIYFFTFRKLCKTFSRRLFHTLGCLAFLLTTEKHLRRGNKSLVKDSLKDFIWQLWIVVKGKYNG